jgi:hypothetical protein
MSSSGSINSSSDEESPIAVPRKRISKRKSIDESSDEDLPISSSVVKKTKNETVQSHDGTASSAADDDDDEEEESDDESSAEEVETSDDDVPLSSIVTSPSSQKKLEKATASKSLTKENQSSAAKRKANSEKKVTKTKKEKTAQAKKKAEVKNKKKDTVMNSAGTNSFVCASAELYSKSEKGKLVQALLCRWWYAMKWPDPSSLPRELPKNADALDGFPGVYVYTKGESVGKLLDLRDKTACPCFNNFARKPATELQQLLLTAIQKQKEELILHEGKGSSTEKDLDTLAKWAAKVNTNKADKDALTVLKAANLSLSDR